jgi:hypothetical protein
MRCMNTRHQIKADIEELLWARAAMATVVSRLSHCKTDTVRHGNEYRNALLLEEALNKMYWKMVEETK